MKTIYYWLSVSGLMALTACTTPQIESSISIACRIATVGSMTFDDYVKSHPGKVDASGLKWKAGAVALIAPICANPDAVSDPAKALDTVIKTGLALSDFISGVSHAPAP